MRLEYLAISALLVGFGTVQAHAQYATQDFTNLLLSNRSGDCTDYAGVYSASVEDITRQRRFNSKIEISADSQRCAITTNGIPNHDFNGPTANFANDVRELPGTFRIPRKPKKTGSQTALSQRSYDAILLNGVPVDLLSAGCYRPSGRRADKNGNVLAGCRETNPWLLDPPSYDKYFGVDLHNAHAQPDGRYHYHSNPNALFLDHDLDKQSPMIGFAADGFPIYGTIFKDETAKLDRRSLDMNSKPQRDLLRLQGLVALQTGHTSTTTSSRVPAIWISATV